MISHAREPSQATFVFYCILFYSFLFSIHPALIAVIHASGNLPSFRSNDSSPRDSKPHMVTLLQSHSSVFCNLFRATSATPNVFRPGRREALFNPTNHKLPTRMIWAASHLTFKSCSFFSLFYFSLTPNKGSEALHAPRVIPLWISHNRSYNGWSGQPLLCDAYLTVVPCAFFLPFCITNAADLMSMSLINLELLRTQLIDYRLLR